MHLVQVVTEEHYSHLSSQFLHIFPSLTYPTSHSSLTQSGKIKVGLLTHVKQILGVQVPH